MEFCDKIINRITIFLIIIRRIRDFQWDQVIGSYYYLFKILLHSTRDTACRLHFMCRHFADWPSDLIHLAEARKQINGCLGLLKSAIIVRTKRNHVDNAKQLPLIKITNDGCSSLESIFY
jgi:hypothetical protein